MKLTYQIVMVCGGFPAVLCICGFVFIAFAMPFIIWDYISKELEKRANEQRRVQLNRTLYKVTYTQLQLALNSSTVECCICLSELGALPNNNSIVSNGVSPSLKRTSTNGKSIVVLPCDARHSYHESCVENWMEYHMTCPLCKSEITQEAVNATTKTYEQLFKNGSDNKV